MAFHRTLSILTGSVLAVTTCVNGVQPVNPAPTAPLTAPPPGAAAVDPAERVKRWTEDLDFLAKEFPAKHKDAFFNVSRENWDKRVEAIRAKIAASGVSDAAIVVELRQLIAMVGDGHSNIWIDRESTVTPFRQYPFAVAWVSDGLFTVALSKENEALLGQRLVKIGATPAEEVAARVATLRAYDNESGRKNSFSTDVRDVESLVALGVLEKAEGAAFTFADASGKETTVTLNPIPTPPPAGFAIAQKPDPESLPIGRRARRPVFGHEVFGDSKTFYIWYDTCNDQKDQTVAQFIEETLKALDGEMAKKPGGVDRVVIDFRRNGGGNSVLFMPMISALAKREAFAERGKIVGLIGRRTFSSAIMNASQLRAGAKAVLVGQPTGGTPNGFGEVKQFRLPNSKMVVQYSTKRFTFDKEGADAVYPDVAVEPSAAEYFSDRDVILEAGIKAWQGGGK